MVIQQIKHKECYFCEKNPKVCDQKYGTKKHELHSVRVTNLKNF